MIMLIALPFFIIFFPQEWFNSSRDICLSQILLNKTCPGCGLTRATISITQFRFQDAWQLNKLSFIIYPFLVMIYFHVWGRLLNKPIFPFLRKFY